MDYFKFQDKYGKWYGVPILRVIMLLLVYIYVELLSLFQILWDIGTIPYMFS